MSPSKPDTHAFAESARQSAELQALRRMLEVSRGTFSLSIAVCNSSSLRDYLIAQLRATDPAIEVVACPSNTTDVFGAVRAATQAAPRTSLFVIGLEDSVSSAAPDQPALRSLNASRDLWERTYRCPVVFWAPEYVASLLLSQAPDLWRYRSHSFEFVSEQADARSGVADHFAGDVDAATQLSAAEKQFRIAELEQRVASAGTKPEPALIPHLLAWLNELGVLYRITGQPKRAIACHEQQLLFARQVADRRNESFALGNLGLAFAALGDARRAIQFFEQHLAIARKIGDRRGEGRALGNLGSAYADLGDARQAIQFFDQHLAIAREIGDRSGEGRALGNLGSAYADLGDARRAIQFFDQHLAIAREIGDRSGEGRALGSLGIAHTNLGDARRAIEFHEQWLAIAREIGDRSGEGRALGSLGSAYADLGDARRAIQFFDQHLAIAREIGDRSGEGRALGSLGIAHRNLGDARRAIEFYEQVLAIMREIGDRAGESQTSWNLGLAYEKLGDLSRAADLMQVRVDFERQIGHADADKHAAYVAALRARSQTPPAAPSPTGSAGPPHSEPDP